MRMFKESSDLTKTQSDKDIDLLYFTDQVLTDDILFSIANRETMRTYPDFKAIKEHYNYLIAKYNDYEDMKKRINSTNKEFYDSVLSALNSKFKIDLNFEDNLFEIEEYTNIIECLYKFLVVKYVKNITKVLSNNIAKNQSDIINQFSEKNSSIPHAKITTIIKNIDKIIDIVITSFNSSEDLISEIIDDDIEIEENYIMHSLFLVENEYNFYLGNEFLNEYLFKVMLNEDNKLNMLKHSIIENVISNLIYIIK